MKIIVGLGNPGDKYKNTRHNFGFLVLDSLANRLGINFKQKKKFQAMVAEAGSDNNRLLLVKPETYMNNSGLAVRKIFDFYGLKISDLLLVYDDLDLPLGTTKTSGKSSAGHRGVESIIGALKSDQIDRIRLGIGKNNEEPNETYVLSSFSDNEKSIVNEVIDSVIGSFDLI